MANNVSSRMLIEMSWPWLPGDLYSPWLSEKIAGKYLGDTSPGRGE